MIKTVNECVGCPPEMGCMGSACPNRNVPILVCDECGEEYVSDLYEFEGQWLCEDCVKEKVPHRFDEDCYETEYLYDDEWLLLDEFLALLPHMSDEDLEWYDEV